MPFTSEQSERFADIISTYVPLAILLDLPTYDVRLDLEKWRKEKPKVLAQEVVGAFNRSDKGPLLARQLFRRFWRDSEVAVRLSEFCNEDGGNTSRAFQASFTLRANMMSSAELRRFLAEVEPRICVVVADAGSGVGPLRGTGFLIGPNLIITAFHTLRYHLAEGSKLGAETCLAVFDHLDGDDPIESLSPPEGRPLRCVQFADEWRVAYSPSSEYDFVLVRLKEPIGLESYAGNGGSRRGWFTYDHVWKLDQDERIIIPQHPSGYRQQQDFGRFVDSVDQDRSIRYTTETALGSSGAPCFASLNDEHKLVAMHNAAYEPYKVPVLNQAIRFDHIASRIDTAVRESLEQCTAPQAKSEIWSVTVGPDYSPILGRKPLTAWIEAAAAETSRPGERVFVVEGTAPRSGRSFTERILRAARRDSQDPVAAIGNERDDEGRRVPLPEDASDVLRAILKELPFKAPMDKLFPPRPVLGGRGKGKLDEWRAELLRSFDELLAGHRVRNVDQRKQAAEAAKKVRLDIEGAKGLSDDTLKVLHHEVERLETLAQSPDDHTRSHSRWDRIWIAVVVAGPSTLSREVTELLSGLIQSNRDELARIRWLLIGDVPDALKALSAHKTERLDPAAIGLDDYVACIGKIAASLGRTISAKDVEVIQIATAGVVDESDDQPDKLGLLQRLLARTGPAYVKRVLSR